MRPIPAQRIGHSHGLLRALGQRGKLRLDEFVTEFAEDDLFPPDLENATGRTRQFVSFARAAGLVKEERGSVELTDLGKRYVKAADRADVFAVSPAQAEWLRRQLREKHLTESIWMGAAIGLSLSETVAPGERVSSLDFGRCVAHLGRAGWDNDNTFQSQGERFTAFLVDLELIDDSGALTETGMETKNDLRLPLHAGLSELAEQLHPDGAEGVRVAAAAEFGDAGTDDAEPVAVDPDPESDPDPEPGAVVDDGADDGEGGDYEDATPDGDPPAMGPIEAAALAAAHAPVVEAPPAGEIAAAQAPVVEAPPAGEIIPPPPVAAGIAPSAALGDTPDLPVTAPSEVPPAAEPPGPEISHAEHSGDGDGGGVVVAPPEDFQQPSPEGLTLPAPSGPDETSGGAMEPPIEPATPADEPAKPIAAIRPTSAIRALRPEDLAAYAATGEIPSDQIDEPDAPASATPRFLDAKQVREIAERRGLKLDPGVYGAAIAALASGRHLVLTGQPGSGKTTLALAIAEAAVKQGRCKSVMFTAAGGFAGTDTFGSQAPGEAFKPGFVPQSIADDKWLVVDELDRVPLDEAFGRLSTILGGHPIELPGGESLEPSPQWRIVATMQDISGIASTSMALRRRFVFIEVPVLEHADLEALVTGWAEGDEIAAGVGRRLVAVNDQVPLGPGLVKDAIAYVRERRALSPAGEVDLTLEALAGFVLPQLEGEGDEVAMRAVRAAGI